jgi:hypothetical protein
MSPNIRIYVRWLRGQMTRTRPNVNPNFDDPESFFLDAKAGVIRANIGDISNFLNAGGTDSPLKNITVSVTVIRSSFEEPCTRSFRYLLNCSAQSPQCLTTEFRCRSQNSAF